MGLLDVLNGMQNGPRGPSTPSAQSDSGGGMSPMTMAILALLAWKGIKHFTGNQAGSAPIRSIIWRRKADCHATNCWPASASNCLT